MHSGYFLEFLFKFKFASVIDQVFYISLIHISVRLTGFSNLSRYSLILSYRVSILSLYTRCPILSIIILSHRALILSNCTCRV